MSCSTSIPAGARSISCPMRRPMRCPTRRRRSAASLRSRRSRRPIRCEMIEIDAVGMYDTTVEEIGQGLRHDRTSRRRHGDGRERRGSPRRGVRNVLRHAGILAGAPETGPTQWLDMPSGDCFGFAEEDGLVEPLKDLGEPRCQGRGRRPHPPHHPHRRAHPANIAPRWTACWPPAISPASSRSATASRSSRPWRAEPMRFAAKPSMRTPAAILPHKPDSTGGRFFSPTGTFPCAPASSSASPRASSPSAAPAPPRPPPSNDVKKARASSAAPAPTRVPYSLHGCRRRRQGHRPGGRGRGVEEPRREGHHLVGDALRHADPRPQGQALRFRRRRDEHPARPLQAGRLHGAELVLRRGPAGAQGQPEEPARLRGHQGQSRR